jgi:hypothetical protein
MLSTVLMLLSICSSILLSTGSILPVSSSTSTGSILLILLSICSSISISISILLSISSSVLRWRTAARAAMLR